jgi:hypothetical protein
LLDPEVKIKPLLEVHVDQVVAAHGAVKGERAAANIKAVEPGDVAGLRDQMFDDLFKIRQLVGQLNHSVSLVIAFSRLMLDQPILGSLSRLVERSSARIGSRLGERRAARRQEQRGRSQAWRYFGIGILQSCSDHRIGAELVMVL